MVLVIILFIISLIITSKICKILFRNTIGTGMAYASRTFVVFIITICVLAAICSSIGLL